MEKVTALVLVLCGCGNVEPLRHDDIYGLTDSAKAWVSGLVTNGRTGAPISGVSIQIEGAATTSDRYGAYRVDGLEPGDVIGSASAQGFVAVALNLKLKSGANSNDIALEPQTCTCAAGQFCDAMTNLCVGPAELTGSVLNACDGTGIDARITIDGKSVCSSSRSGKAYFKITSLRPGGPQVIAFGKPGFVPQNRQLTLQPGFNVLEDVSLAPVNGCPAGAAATAPCTCTDASCQ